MRLFKLFFVIVTICIVAGCASKKTPPKESDESGNKVKLAFVLDKAVNKDLDGRPSPIRIDFYQLTAAEEFEAGDYFDLISKAKETLSDKLLQQDQFMLHPGDLKEMSVKFDSKTKYVGVLASYRSIDARVWKLTFTSSKRPWYKSAWGRYLYVKLDDQTGLQHLTFDEFKKIKTEKKKEEKEKEDKKDKKDKNDKNDKNDSEDVIDEGYFILKDAK